MKNSFDDRISTRRLCLTGILMALNIAFCSVSIPVPGGHLYLCDAIIDTAAILLDPLSAFAVGGIGAFIGDLFFNPDAMYVSLLTHGLQAVVISFFSTKLSNGFRHKAVFSGIGVTIGGIIMVIGYTLGRAFVYRTPEYAILKLPYEILQTALGGAVALFLCYPCHLVALYNKHFRK